MKSKIKLNLGQIVCDAGTFKDCSLEIETEFSPEDAIQATKTLPEFIKHMAEATPLLAGIITNIFEAVAICDNAIKHESTES